jgi:hypothetical protein
MNLFLPLLEFQMLSEGRHEGQLGRIIGVETLPEVRNISK